MILMKSSAMTLRNHFNDTQERHLLVKVSSMPRPAIQHLKSNFNNHPSDLD